MRYPVSVYEVPLPRKVGSTPVRDKPRMVKSFDVKASTVDKARKQVLEMVKNGEHVFRNKDLRSISVSPNPQPSGSLIVYIQQMTREKRNIRRSMKTMEPR